MHYINNKRFPSNFEQKHPLISPVRDSGSPFRQSSGAEKERHTWDRSPIYHKTHTTGIKHRVNCFKYCKDLDEKRWQAGSFYFQSENSATQTSVVNLNHCWGHCNSLSYLLLPRAGRMIGPGIRAFITHELTFRCLLAENSRWIIHHQKWEDKAVETAML